MIVEGQKVKVKWHGTNREWFESKGYTWTKRHDTFHVDLSEMQEQSNVEVEAKCDLCGTKFSRSYKRLMAKEHHFCSNTCAKRYKQTLFEKQRVIKNCRYCENEYVTTKYQDEKYGSKYCSMSCRNQWESENKRGENHHNFTRVLKECDYCGENHHVKKYKLKDFNYHFCSDDCRKSWYAEDWSQSEEWKEESRIRAVRILENDMIGLNSAPQKVTNNILNELKVDFVNEFNCKYYAVDNYLTDYNLMIEVMGTYWHCDPRKYSEISYEAQLKRIHNDKRKSSYIKNKYGINVLYLWENDLLNSAEVCKRLINFYIRKQGRLNNYHSFNYSINEKDKLVLNKNIIKPYFQYQSKEVEELINL